MSLKEDAYIADHCINGRVLYPAAGYLVMVWQALAKSLGQDFTQLPVTIKDFKIHNASIVPDNGKNGNE